MAKKKTSKSNNKKMETEFGVRVETNSILKEINNGCHQQNLVFSPLSLHICLNLLTAGAQGQTLDQLLQLLNAKDVNQLNAQSALFMELVSTGGDGPIVSMVNGIWVDQRFSLKHSFKKLAGDVYKANSQSLDFKKAEQVAKEINVWAEEDSKGHIEKLVSSDFLRGSVLVLANALYFKGSWVNRFQQLNTENEDFRLLNGKRVRVAFMKQQSTMSFYRAMEGFKLLKMEYEKGHDNREYAMYIFLPNQSCGLPKLIQKFHSDPKLFTRNYKLERVKLDNLWLPKLKYEYNLDMTQNIKELGLDMPFQKYAELTGIVDGNSKVYVSNAIQKSYIEVNEEGTIATSITAFRAHMTCLRCGPIINFIADHPFLFMIKEETSGIVLFVGAAFNPLL